MRHLLKNFPRILRILVALPVFPVWTIAAAAAGQPAAAVREIMIGELLPAGVDGQTVEVEGTVTAVSRVGGRLTLELSAGTGRINVTIADGLGLPGPLLMHSHVRATGICHGTYTVDGHWVAGSLFAPGSEAVRILDIAPTLWSEYPLTDLGELAHRLQKEGAAPLVHVRGVVHAGRPEGTATLEDGTGHLVIEHLTQSAVRANGPIEILGLLTRQGGDLKLWCGFSRPAIQGSAGETEALPVLTTAEQIHQLSARESQRSYPVRLRGIVTRVIPENHAIILQDFTRGIYVDRLTSAQRPQVGDYWEIEGTTDPGEYSPFVHATADRRRGLGYLPDPLRPSWDQMLNGSMHCQYVELEGFVTAARANQLTLFTRAGRVQITLDDPSASDLKPYEKAIVRVRGSLFNRWDTQTGRIRIGEFFVGAPTIFIDQEPLGDLLAAPIKRVSELLLFDPHAGPFQRVRVAGKVVHADGPLIFLMDEGGGLRLRLAAPKSLAPGDLVEATGFPEWSGPSPELQEAAVHLTGHAALPAPRRIPSAHLLREEWDSTLVTLEAELLQTSREGEADILQLQNGVHRFVARLPAGGAALPSLPAGSRLSLTGVYVGMGGNRAAGRPIDAFELRLNTAADVRVIARPAWWTISRMLAVIGLLLGVLFLALLWIRQLRRQVEERAGQLEREIGERQRIEQERTLEQERSRVARDLHDELGAGLTEVGMLGALARTSSLPEATKERYLAELTDKARQLVATLDEIVWAVNPRYDSVGSIAEYFSLYAQRFLELATVRCRLDIARDLPEHLVNSKMRHGLFLAFKEALNNIVRHARASEVTLTLAVLDRQLVLTVTDNGCGLAAVDQAPGQDGLAGITERIRSVGGRCLVESTPGTGTSLRFCIPLP
ncbi:MAG: hypothetical protein HYV95_03540 [Opitutae bacterium]|nr:hypothetical protein [Opitutae bacterium]